MDIISQLLVQQDDIVLVAALAKTNNQQALPMFQPLSFWEDEILDLAPDMLATNEVALTVTVDHSVGSPSSSAGFGLTSLLGKLGLSHSVDFLS